MKKNVLCEKGDEITRFDGTSSSSSVGERQKLRGHVEGSSSPPSWFPDPVGFSIPVGGRIGWVWQSWFLRGRNNKPTGFLPVVGYRGGQLCAGECNIPYTRWMVQDSTEKW